MFDYAQIAATLATYLAPFTPYLVEGGKKFAGKAGEAAWKKAEDIWGKIQAHFGDDKAIKGAAMMVSSAPGDEGWQAQLAKALSVRLKDNPSFAQELLDLLGGKEAVQQVIAERKSWVEDVTQEIEGTKGSQIVQAKGQSTITGVRQKIKN